MLTGADAAVMAVPADERVSGGLAAELVIVETIGNLALSWLGRMISVAGGPIGDRVAERGLANLPRRAEQVGGAFTLECPASGGTALHWSAPL